MILILSIISLTYPGSIFSGDRLFYSDARSMSLGGTSIDNIGGVNPAVFPENRLSINFSYNPVFASEKRGLRVYDNYGNNMGIATISDNMTSINRYYGLLAIKPVSFLYCGCRFAPVWDFSYNYLYESRDDFYQLLSIEEIINQGAINNIEPAVGLAIGKLSLGFAYIVQFGKVDYCYRLITSTGPDSIAESSTRYHGSTGRAGICFNSGVGLDLGYAYTYKISLSTNDSGSDLEYPAGHVIQLSYQPPNRIPTKLIVELDYEQWDEPLFIYKFGVEHLLARHHCLRYGFCLLPDYNEKSIWTTAFCLGYGTKIKPFTIDIAYSYAKRDYSSSNFSLDFPRRIYFNEHNNSVALSIGYYF